MSAATDVVQWGRTTIAFTLRRSAREKTVSIAVEPGGDVVVTAPRAAAVERIRGIVLAKARWIVDRRRRVEGLDPAPTREYESGETFLYRGRQHRLLVATEGVVPEVKLTHGRLHVRLPARTPASRRAAAVEDALVAWYRTRADAKLPELVTRCVQRLSGRFPGRPGITPTRAPRPSPPAPGTVATFSLAIVDQQKRWASCSAAGQIRLNWRLIQAPTRLVEYVVLHEVTHLRVPSHDEAFWAALGALLPDYERRREDLRRLGPRLVW